MLDKRLANALEGLLEPRPAEGQRTTLDRGTETVTPSEIVDASQSVCSDYTDQYPTTRAVSYSRLDARQKEVFASLAGWDPDHFGMQDIVELLGSSTFRFAEVLRRPAASITDIFVERADGNSAWPRGRRVNIVPSDDIDGHDPPRALIRNYELILVGDDGFGQGEVAPRLVLADAPAHQRHRRH